jgi:hypothetical protein
MTSATPLNGCSTPPAYETDHCQAARAEALGGLTFVFEHHFIEDGYTPSMLASGAIAARTQRIRIGTSVLLLRCTTSAGCRIRRRSTSSRRRFDLGVGRGIASESSGFAIPAAARRAWRRRWTCCGVALRTLPQEYYLPRRTAVSRLLAADAAVARRLPAKASRSDNGLR